MAQTPARLLRSRPDFYVKRFREKYHKQSVKSKLDAIRLHDAYRKEVKRIAKSDLSAVQKSRAFVAIGEDFHDRFEERHRKRIDDALESSAKDTHDIINLMLPKGVRPPSKMVVPEFWGREFKGSTPEERLARVRLRTRKKMSSIMTRNLSSAVARKVLSSADIEAEEALSVFDEVKSMVSVIAGNDPWLAVMWSAAVNYNANAEVIDHYEFLATLDALTCEECGALDGTIIPVYPMSSEEDMDSLAMEAEAWVSRHPNCRCTSVPVSKTWKELDLEPMDEPEGSRIARTGYPIDGPNGRDWGPSSPGPDSVQDYVPADTRYKDWTQSKGAK